MIHPHTELRKIDTAVGFGVFATKPIPRGTITWVLDRLDMVLQADEVTRMPAAYLPILDRYTFRDHAGNYVLCWDFGRYMNHSCEPTTTCVGEICDVALRDIQPGEQLTCEYALLNNADEMTCRCGAPHCRGKIARSDLPAVAKVLDEATRVIVPELKLRPQPLLEFMLPGQRARLDAILSGREPVPSCLENRLAP